MKWKKFAKYVLVGIGVFLLGHGLDKVGIDTFFIETPWFLTSPFTIAGWLISLIGVYKGVRDGESKVE